MIALLNVFMYECIIPECYTQSTIICIIIIIVIISIHVLSLVRGVWKCAFGFHGNHSGYVGV